MIWGSAGAENYEGIIELEIVKSVFNGHFIPLFITHPHKRPFLLSDTQNLHFFFIYQLYCQQCA